MTDDKNSPTDKIVGSTDGLGIWMLDDCDYVVAASKEEAIAWYEKEILGEPVGDVDEAGWDWMINVAEEGEPNHMVTIRESVQRDIAAGEKPPFIAGTDGHYA